MLVVAFGPILVSCRGDGKAKTRIPAEQVRHGLVVTPYYEAVDALETMLTCQINDVAHEGTAHTPATMRRLKAYISESQHSLLETADAGVAYGILKGHDINLYREWFAGYAVMKPEDHAVVGHVSRGSRWGCVWLSRVT